MKKLLALVILAAAGYFGYTWYETSLNKPTRGLNYDSSMSLNLHPPELKTPGVLNVLGTTTSNIITKTTELLNSATGGAAEPVINQAVSDLQDRIKSLPEKEYQKVKYEFCKDILPSPNPSSDIESL